MKASEIKVGKRYTNKGKGRVWREVIEVTRSNPPQWLGSGEPPDEPHVIYIDSRGKTGSLFISSFARWASEEVILF